MSERIARSSYVDGAWLVDDRTGTHITLPLDPAQYDDAAVEAAVSTWFTTYLDASPEMEYMHRMRAALAAYANHVAGGAA